MSKKNISHWYDGWFYNKFIAPNQEKLFEIIKKNIPEQSSLLDIACATGRLGFYLSDHCKHITGVDLSQRNITTANTLLSMTKVDNLKFIHGNVLNLDELISEKYDFVSITYAIHEMPEEIRLEALKRVFNAGKNVIIADYAIPQQANFYAKLNKTIEFVAGRDHYTNFKSFCKAGGIDYYLQLLNIQTQKKISLNHGNTMIYFFNLT